VNLIKLIKEEYKNIINEIGDSSAKSYDYEVIGTYEDESIEYRFITDLNTKYEVGITEFYTQDFSKRGNTGISVDFIANDSIKIENKGELYKVMATITNIIKNYVKNKKIDFIHFQTDNKRHKLYATYLKKYFLKKIETEDNNVYYFLKKNLNEDYSNQTEEDIQALVDIIDIDPDSPKMDMYKDTLKNKYNYEYIKPEIRYEKDIEIVNKIINKKYKTITNKGLEFYFITKALKDLPRTVLIKVHNKDNDIIGEVGFNINTFEKSIKIGGANIIEKYRRKGIYTKIVDYIESIATKYNLEIKEAGRSSDARAFWNNRK
jgi:uncharacterized protein YlxP (DUF503 family)